MVVCICYARPAPHPQFVRSPGTCYYPHTYTPLFCAFTLACLAPPHPCHLRAPRPADKPGLHTPYSGCRSVHLFGYVPIQHTLLLHAAVYLICAATCTAFCLLHCLYAVTRQYPTAIYRDTHTQFYGLRHYPCSILSLDAPFHVQFQPPSRRTFPLLPLADAHLPRHVARSSMLVVLASPPPPAAPITWHIPHTYRRVGSIHPTLFGVGNPVRILVKTPRFPSQETVPTFAHLAPHIMDRMILRLGLNMPVAVVLRADCWDCWTTTLP